MPYIHPIAQERISEMENNIKRLQSEIATCTEGAGCVQVMKDEIKYWRQQKSKLKKNPKLFI